MKNWKRILSLLLVLTMCLSLLPLSALAEDGAEDEPVIEEVEDLPAPEEGGEDEPCGHEPAEAVTENTVAPTCTEPGSHDAVVYCALCGAELSRETVEDPASGHTPVDVEEIPAEPGKPGMTAGVICAVCGEILEGCELIPALPEEIAGIDSLDEVSADSVTVSSGECGSEGGNVTWALDDEGVLTISGSGAMADFSDDARPWYEQRDTIQRVVITSGVTSISTGAFSECSGLTSVTIPESVTSIGTFAFNLCTGLTSMTIPEGVTDIARGTFSNCEALTDLTIPEGVTSIGSIAFSFCYNLTSVTIPASVTSIGSSAFYGCGGLTSVTIPASVNSIGSGAFGGCALLTAINADAGSETFSSDDSGILYSKDRRTLIAVPGALSGEYVVPADVTSIGDGAFSGCSGLTNVTIPEGVTSIGNGAFVHCEALTTVTIPSTATDLGTNLFFHCHSLKRAVIPAGVTILNGQSFANCYSLESVVLPEGMTAIGSAAFGDCSSLTEITLPSTVTYIGSDAFHGCSLLASITLPAALETVMARAFSGCSVLTDVYYGGSEDDWSTKVTVHNDDNENDPLLNAAFHYNSTPPAGSGFCGDPDVNDGKDVSWSLSGAGVLTISGSGAMANYTPYSRAAWFDADIAITSLMVESGVTSIGDAAFTGCDTLNSVSLPGTLTGIGDSAFGGCSGLTGVTIPASVTSIGDAAFSHCDAVTVAAGNSAYASENGALFNKNKTELLHVPGSRSGSYTVPSSVTTIGTNAFGGCGELTQIVLPVGLLTIGDGAFSGCWSLESLTIPEGVTSIGNGAFVHCEALTTVTIPSTATDLGTNLFFNCYSLKSAVIPEGVTILNGQSFANCYALESVVLPEGMTAIGSAAFGDCLSLTEITLPSTVTTIGSNAFSNCSMLASITLPAALETVMARAFSGCSALTDVYYTGSEDDWSTKVTVHNESNENDPLLDAAFHYNYVPVAVSASNFPDAAFLAYVGQNLDGNGDGTLSENEIRNVTTLNVEGLGISSLDGVAIFTGLTELCCKNNELTELDVSGLNNLTKLDCSYNQIETLTFGSDCKLFVLHCDHNILPALDLSICPLVAQLWCWNNSFTQLDITPAQELIDAYTQGEAERFDGGVSYFYGHTDLSVSDGVTIISPSYVVRYSADGAEGVPAAQTKQRGQALTLSSQIPVRDGYDFIGWATVPGSNQVIYLPGEKYSDDANLWLYAAWTEKGANLGVNVSNFPDAAFRAYVSGNFDKNHDNELSEDELAAVTEIKVANRGITSLVGVKHFPSLQFLICNNNALTSLDVSGLSAFKELRAGGNADLAELNVSGCTALEILGVRGCTALSSLDLSGHAALRELLASGTGLDALDLSPCPNLRTLVLSGSHRLTSLDLSNTRFLEQLDIPQTGITAIDLSPCPGLALAYRGGSRTVTLEGGATLTVYGGEGSDYALCLGEQVTAVTANVLADSAYFPDAAFLAYVKTFDTDGDGVFSDTELAAVTEINVEGLGIVDLRGLVFFRSINVLNCKNNALTELDVSGLRLGILDCSYNRIETLILGSDCSLFVLHCDHNMLPALDLSACPRMTQLWCWNNPFTQLDITPAQELISAYTQGMPERIDGGVSYLYGDADLSVGDGVSIISPSYVVRYSADGAEGVPAAQTKQRGQTLTLSSQIPVRDGYDFLGWATVPGSDQVSYLPGSKYSDDANLWLYAAWAKRDEPEEPPEVPAVVLDRSYLTLALDDEEQRTAQLSVVGLDPQWAAGLAWAASADGAVPDSEDNTLPISVSAAGLVSAKSEGTAFAVAYLRGEDGRVASSAACRIDVTNSRAAVTEARLPETKVTTELYSTAYAELPVELVLGQNIEYAQSMNAEGNSVSAGTGGAIKSAEFTDENTAAVFELRVKDDRTLLVVPKDEFVNGDAAKLKTLKGSYKSAVAVTVEGQTEKFETKTPLTITVKRNLPKLNAANVKLNTYIANDTQPLVITGGTVLDLTVDTSKKNITWVKLDGFALTYKGERNKGMSGKLNLLAEVEGWAKPVPVAVSVSASNLIPKLSFKPATLTLKPGTCDEASTAITVTPANYEDSEITVAEITEGSTKYPNGKVLDCEVSGHTLTVRPVRDDGAAHTYKVMLAIKGKTYPLTVKTLAKKAAVTLSVKAAGFIDTAIPNSAITLTATPKNFNAGSGESYSVHVTKTDTKTKTETEVTELLDIDVTGNVITLTEKRPGSLASGYVYNAYTKADVGGTETPAVKTKLTVKWSQPAKVPASVTLKVTGAIDVIRPGSVVTVTPTVKNCFTYVPEAGDLHIYKQQGKDFIDVTDTAENPFAVHVENGVFLLSRTGGIDHKADKFKVSLKTTMDGRPVSSAQVAVTVKMGASKFAQNVKSVTLLKDDRYDRAVLRLTPEAGLSGIKRVSLVSPADKNKRTVFALTPLGNNEYAIGYNGNKLPDPGFKGGTVKLQVFLDGNLTTTPNATLSVSIKLN